MRFFLIFIRTLGLYLHKVQHFTTLTNCLRDLCAHLLSIVNNMSTIFEESAMQEKSNRYNRQLINDV